MFTSPYKAGVTTVAALIGAGAALPVSAGEIPVSVPWTGPDSFYISAFTGPMVSIDFLPITNVIGFQGIDRGIVDFMEFMWSLVVRLDDVWTPIYTLDLGNSMGGNIDLATTVEAVSFATLGIPSPATLTGIGFAVGSDEADFSGLEGALFTFTREVNAVPSPGSLPLLAAAVGAFGLVRLRRARQH